MKKLGGGRFYEKKSGTVQVSLPPSRSETAEATAKRALGRWSVRLQEASARKEAQMKAKDAFAAASPSLENDPRVVVAVARLLSLSR